MIDQLELHNLTVFDKSCFDFSHKVNIIIGENATGKTHLLKLAYALCCIGSGGATRTSPIDQNDHDLVMKLDALFPQSGGILGQLHRHGATTDSEIRAEFSDGFTIDVTFGAKSRTQFKDFTCTSARDENGLPPIFIPTKEVLSFVQGITSNKSDRDTLDSLFDATYFDLCDKVKRPVGGYHANLVIDPRIGTLLPQITDLLRGRFEFTDDGLVFQQGRYYDRRVRQRNGLGGKHETLFKHSRSGDLAGCMTAEGFRKIGIVQQLLRNEGLVPGLSGPLFWDEPEANLNPRQIRFLVELLLQLARNGQQIIVATHDYVVLKWFDLLCNEALEDHVRYFSLFRDLEDSAVQVETSDDYVYLQKNAVGETYSELYDVQVDKAFQDHD